MGGVEYQEKLSTEPVGYVSLVKQVKDDNQEVVETTLNTAWTQLVYTDDYVTPRLREMRNRVDSQGARANLQSTEYTYDGYGRVSKKTVHQAVVQDVDSSDDVYVSDDAVAVEYTYSYESGRDNISAYSVEVGNNTLTETIARDCMGRITSISRTDGTTTQYVYDKRGRLVSDGEYDYTYDNDGNILTKGDHTYTYSRSNRLVAYDGYLFAYDDRGNPTHYKVSSLDTQPNMAWSRGRQLVEYGDISYRYDANRIRVTKETDSYRYEYITNGEHNVTAEYHYDKARQEYVRMINYVYNGGTAESMVLSTLTDGGYSTSRYYLVHDVHGNVSRLLNPDGTLCATYHYDAWGNGSVFDGNGNPLDYSTDSDNIAFLNPFRYRGYYYDVETGLYYLQIRYYDPDTGRFVSPDTPDYLDAATTGGLNLYAYCLNDPINNTDPFGNFAQRGHQGNMRSFEFRFFSDELLIEMYQNLCKKGRLSPEEKVLKEKIKTELKARGYRNVKKRKGYGRSKSVFAGNNGAVANDTLSDKTAEEDNVISNPTQTPIVKDEVANDTNVQDGDEILGVGLLLVGVLGLAYVIGNDITGVGIADDAVGIATACTTISNGWSMIFG